MDNRTIARVLHEIADLLEIKGENSFRIRSYRMAAETLENHGQDVAEMARRGEDLRSLPGVGAGIAGKIQEIVAGGDCAYHRELLDEVPGGLLELLKIPGLGPKGVRLVWQKLGVKGPEDLEAAIADGRFRTLPGMKEKKEARILKGLEERRSRQGRFLLPVADAAAESLAVYLRARGALRVEAAGSMRRRRETIGDLDLLVTGGDARALSAAFVADPDVATVLAHGETKSSVVLRSGLQVDLRQVEAGSFGAALQYFTGSKTHNVALRERAIKRGLKLNEYGLFRAESGEPVAGASEEDVYAALGLAWVPPELREDRGEIALAEKDELPRLVELPDVRGDLHVHTTESDGRDDLETMVEAARARGLQYLAITDHTRGIPSRARQDRGMDETRCLAHAKRIRALQKRYADIRLLTGVEVDILEDGRLEMADEVLAQLDVVVASLHSAFDLPREAQTERVLKALAHPHVHIFGHPLARLLLEREPVALDVEAVLREAASRGVALEINGQPARLDLPDYLVRAAREQGAHFVLSSDAHARVQLGNMAYAVGQARRAGLEAADILNARQAEALLSAGVALRLTARLRER